MSLTKSESINLFKLIESQSVHDNKITKNDLEKFVAVDTDNDDKITDKVQTKI